MKIISSFAIILFLTMLQSFVEIEGRRRSKSRRNPRPEAAYDLANREFIPNHRIGGRNSQSPPRFKRQVTNVPYVGMPCGSAETKDCDYGAIYTNPGNPDYTEEQFIITCPVGGKTGTCPVARANGSILACQGTNTDGFYCKNCSPWGQTCRKDEDCCVGFNEGMQSYPLPLVMKPFCLKPFITVLGLTVRASTGTCRKCLHDWDPCKGSKIPLCGKLNYTASTAACRSRYTGGKAGVDNKGHNMQMGWIFENVSPDPCTPEADLALIGGYSFPKDGSSNCYHQGVSELAESAYETSYFCNCPQDAVTGYSCQVNNTALGLLNQLGLGALGSQTDNGKRCQKCGLWGQVCGAQENMPCCDEHTCVENECVPNTCTRLGDRYNKDGEETPCCGAPKHFRDLKEHRCTDNKCNPGIGDFCRTHYDCCGSHVCQLQSKISLNGTCQECMEDGVQYPPGRKCVDIYDCCTSHALYTEDNFQDYSICLPLEEYGTNYCTTCIPQNGACNEWDHCCGGYECDNEGTKTCCLWFNRETGETENKCST